jgi:hypothetical protein
VPRSRPAAVLDPPGSALAARLQAAQALAARHRRLAAAVCAGAAVLAAVSALTPAAPALVPAASAAAGLVPVALPAGAGSSAAGSAHRVAVTVRVADAAETLLLRPGIHVEVIGGAPAGSAAATGGEGDASVLAADAVVLVVPQPAGDAAADTTLLGGSAGSAGVGTALGGVAVLSVSPADARRLAAAAGTRPLSVTVALPEP